MERFFSLLLFFMCYVLCVAQITFSANAPRDGDDVTRTMSLSFCPSGQGSDNAVWDISQVEFARKQIPRSYIQESDTGDILTVYELDSKMNYSLIKNLLTLNGYETQNFKITFDMPVTALMFPMNYGDSLKGYLHGTGIYCDRQRVRSFGTWSLKADARGELILPSLDTLRHVIRLHLQQCISNRYYPLDSMNKVLPAFNTDSILYYQLADTAMMVSDCYLWFAPGYRYPVLEYRSAFMKAIPSQKLSAAYYCSPHVQEALAWDPENIKIRNEYYKNTNKDENTAKRNDFARNNFQYNFYQNAAAKEIHIDFMSEVPCRVKVLLAGTTGIVYRTAEDDGKASGQIVLDYGNLQTGQYVVYIKTSNATYIEKFNHL